MAERPGLANLRPVGSGNNVVEAIAQRAAAIVLAQLDAHEANGTPWLSGAQAAADYLDWPRERVYKHLGSLPHYRHEGRLMFRKDELDTHLNDRKENTR